MIATLNSTQTNWAFDGDRFWDYIRDGIVHTMEINHDVNFGCLLTMTINGRKEYVCPGEEFRRQVVARFG